MKKNLGVIILSILFIVGCTSKKQESSSDSTFDGDTTSVNKDSLPTSDSKTLSRRVLSIDSDFYETFLNNSNKKIVDKEKYSLSLFTRLKDGQDHFTYYLIDSLNFNNKFNSCLIAENYESEDAVWLVNFDVKGGYIDALELYYDNAEGAWYTSTSIDEEKGTLEIKRSDIYAEPTISIDHYRTDESGKMIKE